MRRNIRPCPSSGRCHARSRSHLSSGALRSANQPATRHVRTRRFTVEEILTRLAKRSNFLKRRIGEGDLVSKGYNVETIRNASRLSTQFRTGGFLLHESGSPTVGCKLSVFCPIHLRAFAVFFAFVSIWEPALQRQGKTIAQSKARSPIVLLACSRVQNFFHSVFFVTAWLYPRLMAS